jgi:hypothetical protein
LGGSVGVLIVKKRGEADSVIVHAFAYETIPGNVLTNPLLGATKLATKPALATTPVSCAPFPMR